MSTMPVLLPLLLLALAIGWGFFIGMKRTRARFFVVLVCLIFAIAVTAGLRSVTFAELKDRLDPVIAGSNSETLQDAWEMILDSDTVQEAALAGAGGTAGLCGQLCCRIRGDVGHLLHHLHYRSHLPRRVRQTPQKGKTRAYRHLRYPAVGNHPVRADYAGCVLPLLPARHG